MIEQAGKEQRTMKTGKRFTALWVVTLLALAMALAWQGHNLAEAQTATPTPSPTSAPTPTPAPATPPAVPSTLQEVEAQITQIEAEIKQLNEQADKLISASEMEQKRKLRDQIKVRKQQLTVLKRQRERLTNTASSEALRQIQDRYRARIQQLENEATRRRRETIARYEAILARDPNSRVAPDVLWRLAYLYFEESHANYLNAWDSYEQASDQLYRQGNTEANVQEPKHDYTPTVTILDKLLKQFPNYEKKDDVLYLLAYCLQEMDDNDRALTIYERIITETPDSAMVPEAYVRQGEIHFDRAQAESLDRSKAEYERAIELYNKVLQFRGSKFYDKALYKIGWSYYLMNEYDQAVKYFTDVLTYYRDHPSRRGGRTGQDLRQDSVNYIAISFTESAGEQGSAREGIAFVQQFGDREIGREVLLKIAQVYDDQTKYEAAREAYEAYIHDYPLAPDLPGVYRAVATTYEKETNYEMQVETYMRLARDLGPDSPWMRANSGRSADVEEAINLVQNSIFAAGTYYHEMGQKATSEAERNELYKRAIAVYSQYLERYPNADNAYQTAFNLAECYYTTKQYEPAAMWYRKVIDMKKDETYWADALFKNAKSFEMLVEQQGGLPNREALEEAPQTAQGGGQQKKVTIKPVEMSPTVRKWVEALLLHVQYLPQADDSPTLLYKVGEIYYLHGDFPNSRKYFKQLLAQYPNNAVVKLAAFYGQETYRQTEDWVGLREWIAGLPGSGAIDRSQIEQVSAGASFKIAEQLMKQATETTPANRDLVQRAIQEYVSAVDRNPDNPNAGTALYNVAVAYENHLNDMVRANDMYVRMAQKYPKNELAAKALWHAAYNWQVLIEFDRAIEAYRLYARLFPTDQNGGNALLNAGELLEDSGRGGEAVAVFQEFLNRYPTANEASEFAFRIAIIYERMGSLDAATNAYDAYGKRGNDDANRMIEAYYRWGRIMEGRGNWPEAEKRYLQAKAIYLRVRSPEVDSQYAAESAFRIADHNFQAYKRITYTGNSRRDAPVFKQKGELAKQLKAAFEEIITFNNYTWATAALYMVGATLNEFADSALTAPAPNDLPPEMADEYLFKLEEAVIPFKNAALEWFKRCLNKGIEQRMINEWVVKSYQAILKIEQDTVEPKFEAIAVTILPATTIPAVRGYTAPPPLPPSPMAPEPGAPAPAGTTPPAGGTLWRQLFGWGAGR